MKLIGLTTQNFKKLRDFRATFTDGLNVICGENFQGKSTLLQAIAVALYGISATPSKKEDIPTWGAKNFKTTLDFSHDGRTFQIVRDKANAKITEGGDLVASGHSPCTKFVEELLGLNYKDFCLFVLSSQGETAGVLTFGATALQRRVEDFSGASVIDKVLSRVRTESSRIAGSMDIFEYADPKPLEQVVRKASASALELQSSVEQLKGSIDLQGAWLTEKATELAQLERQQRSYGETADQRARLEATLDSVIQQLSDLEAIDPQLVDVKPMNADLSIYREQLGDLNKKARAYDQLEARATNASEQMDQLRPRLAVEESYLEEKSKLEATLESAVAELRPVEDEYQGLSRQLKAAKQAEKDGICPSCARPFEDHDPEKLKSEVEQLQGAVDDANHRRVQRDRNVALANQSLKNLKAVPTGIQEQIDAGQRLCDRLTEQLAGLVRPDATQIKDLEAVIFDLSGKVQGVRSSNQTAQGQLDQMENLRDRLAGLLEKQSGLPSVEPVDQTHMANLRAEVNDLQVALSEERSKLSDLRLHLNNAQSHLKSSEGGLKVALDRNQQLAELSAELDKHKRLGKYLGDTRSTYLSQVWGQILNLASSKCALSSNNVITKLGRTDAGDFVFTENGKETPIAGASGAQKGHIGVAVRVGLSAALYGNAGTLILDEPTESMSEKQSQQLAGALMGLSGQCLLVTHRPLEQLAAQNVIRVGA